MKANWILSGIVVRSASEHFESDHTFAKRVVRTCKALLDDVAKQVLALTAGAEGSAPKNVIQEFADLRPSPRRNQINRRTVVSGHKGRGLFACRAGMISILLLKRSARILS